jgi:hypothetical protein
MRQNVVLKDAIGTLLISRDLFEAFVRANSHNVSLLRKRCTRTGYECSESLGDA